MKAEELVASLIALARECYQRGWMWGTSGNLSVKVGEEPPAVAITGSGANKGALGLADIVIKPEALRAKYPWLPPAARPASGETLIHRAIYEHVAGAGAVLHVHTVASTALSLAALPAGQALGSVHARGLEMLKGWGLPWEAGGLTAEIPVLANDADMGVLAANIGELLKEGQRVPCLLVAGHGVTVWGSTLEEARNRLEIAEFVCQVLWEQRR